MNNEKKAMRVNPLKKPLKGTFAVPADKSISHRTAMFGALCGSEVKITNFSQGGDCKSTLGIIQALGADVTYYSENDICIKCEKLQEAKNVLDAGNSGTTIRLMSGILSGQDFYSVFTGDESLRSRPMARIIKPLRMMGANIWARENDTKAPISIKGTKLSGITYESPIASAQIKSAVLLAGLNAEGATTVIEPVRSRDHSERMLKYLGADLEVDGTKVTVKPSKLEAKPLSVPGDISSAAFFMVAGSIVPDSEIEIQNVGLNPTRTGIIDVLRLMGADITIQNERMECGEEVGDVLVRYAQLKGITIEEDMVPRVIDELPVIAVAATQAEGTTVVKGAEDLRHKESDRIKAVCSELGKLGANIQETPDGFVIYGKSELNGACTVETYHDHRIAMSAYIAGLVSKNPIDINEFHWVNISFPTFTHIFENLSPSV